MATPRCLRPLLAPSKRIKISPPSRSCLPGPYGFVRMQSSGAENDGGNTSNVGNKDNHVTPQLKNVFDEMIKNRNMSLDELLGELEVDPKDYREASNTFKRAERKEREQDFESATQEELDERMKRMREQPDHNMLLHAWKRAGIEPIKLAKERGITLHGEEDKTPLDAETQKALDELRAPINVRAINLRPFRRSPEYGVPVCDLQLRTYSIRNLLLFADFAVRAAYYMGLCARGPVPLPRITERWTVPRSNFIFKKSQENFERITMRRLIQIQDGHPDVVKAWLAFLQKHQYHGVGMKANIWEYESLDAATRAGYDLKEGDHSRRNEGPMMDKVEEILNRKGFKEAMEGHKSGDVQMRF